MREWKATLRTCAILIGLIAGACMNNPRDGAQLSSETQSISFDGFASKPGTFVTISILKWGPGQPDRWVDLWSVRSSTTATVDGADQNWYRWQFRRPIPQNNYYWTVVENQPKEFARLKATGPDAPNGYFTFSTNDDFCLNNNSTSGAAMISNCAENTPVVRVNAPCGTNGLRACGNEWCVEHSAVNYGLDPDATLCQPCGGLNQICCNDTTANFYTTRFTCGSNLKCSTGSGMCVPR